MQPKEFDLKAFRESMGFKTQTSFGKELNFPPSALSLMERGERPVSDPLLLRLETRFKVDLDIYKKYIKNVNNPELRLQALSRLKEMEERGSEPEPVVTSIFNLSKEELMSRYVHLLETRLEEVNNFKHLQEQLLHAIHELDTIKKELENVLNRPV